MKRLIYTLLALTIMMLSGCGKQDKEILATIGKKITLRFESAVTPTRKKLEVGIQAMKGEMLESSLVDTVLFRIRTDKNLKDHKIEVVSTQDGVITLKGNVPDEPSKVRAIEVAESTKGVTKVESELIEKPLEDPSKKTIEAKDSDELKKEPSTQKQEPTKEMTDPVKVPEKPKVLFEPFDPNKPNEKEEQEKPAPPLK